MVLHNHSCEFSRSQTLANSPRGVRPGFASCTRALATKPSILTCSSCQGLLSSFHDVVCQPSCAWPQTLEWTRDKELANRSVADGELVGDDHDFEVKDGLLGTNFKYNRFGGEGGSYQGRFTGGSVRMLLQGPGGAWWSKASRPNSAGSGQLEVNTVYVAWTTGSGTHGY